MRGTFGMDFKRKQKWILKEELHNAFFRKKIQHFGHVQMVLLKQSGSSPPKSGPGWSAQKWQDSLPPEAGVSCLDGRQPFSGGSVPGPHTPAAQTTGVMVLDCSSGKVQIFSGPIWTSLIWASRGCSEASPNGMFDHSPSELLSFVLHIEMLWNSEWYLRCAKAVWGSTWSFIQVTQKASTLVFCVFFLNFFWKLKAENSRVPSLHFILTITLWKRSHWQRNSETDSKAT